MKFTVMSDLCESHLIPSKQALKSWKADELRELTYLYFLGLRVALSHEATKHWAERFMNHAIEHNDFAQWRGDGNDLYAMLYALSSDDDFASETGIAIIPVRDWLKHSGTNLDARTHKLFNRLDAMLHIKNSDLKAYRRRVANWSDLDKRERNDTTGNIIQRLMRLAPKSELIGKLKSVTEQFETIDETASAGATGAASVATVVGGLGAGFDPNGDRGIYQNAKSIKDSKKKPLPLLR